jgi:RNA polymerase sigma factor (sigma-70 family)
MGERQINPEASAIFGEIAMRYERQVTASFRPFVTPQECQDRFMKAVLKVLEHPQYYQNMETGEPASEDQMISFLSRVAKTTSIDAQRRSTRESALIKPLGNIDDTYPDRMDNPIFAQGDEDLVSKEPSPEAVALQHEEESMLRLALNELLPDERTVIMEYYSSGDSVREVAERLDIKLNRANKLISTGRAKLRKILESEFRED